MIRTLWPLLIGFAIWGLAFGALYGVQALGCVWGWPHGLHRAVLATIWIVTLAGLGVVLLVVSRGHGVEARLKPSAVWLTWAAIAATVLAYFPLAFVSVCL